jgi:leucyl-tRNA synthetase
MELVNDLYAEEPRLSGATVAEALEKLTLLLGPFAPYLAQEIWEELGHAGPVFRETWPAYDPELAKEDLAEIVVQVNGKLRSHIYLPFGTPEEVLKARALEDPKVRPFVDGKQIVKVIVVPDRLVNIVVAGARA